MSLFGQKMARHAATHSHEILVALILEGEKLHLVVLLLIGAGLIAAFSLQVALTEKWV